MNPHELAEERVKLAAEYARESEKLSQILTQKASLWMQLREDAKSDKAADRMWEATPLGIEEMKLKLSMKSKEKSMSAAKSMLDVLEGEARNQY